MLLRCATVIALLTTPVLADQKPHLTGQDFIMPSRNVGCVKLDPENGLSDRLYCLRFEPELIAVVLDSNGANWSVAEGDQPYFDGTPVLDYGKRWYKEGFTCDSAEKGVICRHNKYGAFRLSRKGMERLK